MEYSTGDGATALAILDELVPLYLAVYAEPPYNSPALCSEDAFRARTTRQAGRDGFAITTARTTGGELQGFSFGFSFGPGGWWSGEADPPSPEVLAGPKFAVIELVVSRAARGQGIGRRLINLLLVDRPEPYAMLTAVPAAPARAIYEHWGWRPIGHAKHQPDAEIMDQLLIPLR